MCATTQNRGVFSLLLRVDLDLFFSVLQQDRPIIRCFTALISMYKLSFGLRCLTRVTNLPNVATNGLKTTAYKNEITYRRLTPLDEECAVDIMKRFFIKNEAINKYVLKYDEAAIEADVHRMKVTFFEILPSYDHLIILTVLHNKVDGCICFGEGFVYTKKE